MKSKGYIVTILLLSFLVIAMLGCSQPAPSPAPVSPAAPVAAPSVPASWPKVLYSCSSGGATLPWALKTAELAPKYVGIKIIDEPVAGAIEAALRLAKGDFDLGATSGDKAYGALVGGKGYENAPKDSYRLLSLAQDTVLFLVTKANSGIKSLADLKGKKVAYGKPRFVTEDAIFKDMFKAAGLDPEKDIFQMPPGERPDMANGLIEGRFDAIQWVGSYPDATLTEAMKTTPMLMIPLSQKELAVLEKYPMFFPTNFPAGVYPGQSTEVPIMSTGRIHECVKKTLPDDLVYALTKMTFEHLDEYHAVHVSFKPITTKTALEPKYLNIPVHTGAVKYVKEKGIWTDADVKKNDTLLADLQSKLK